MKCERCEGDIAGSGYIYWDGRRKFDVCAKCYDKIITAKDTTDVLRGE